MAQTEIDANISIIERIYKEQTCNQWQSGGDGVVAAAAAVEVQDDGGAALLACCMRPCSCPLASSSSDPSAQWK